MRRPLIALAALGACWALSELAALAGVGPSLTGMGAGILASPFASAALGGAFLLHALSRRPARERLFALPLGLGIVAALHLFLVVHPWDAMLAGLGLGSVLTLAVAAVRARAQDRQQALGVLLPGLVLPGFAFVSVYFLELTVTLRPTTFDAFAFHADQGFGIQPAFVMNRLFTTWPTLATAAGLIYLHLPLAFAAVQGAFSRAQLRRGPEALTAFLAVAAAGYPLYLFFPVVGPIYVFGGFPWAPPAPGTVPLAPLEIGTAWRNCMPSLHAAWALMAFWLAYPLGLWPRLVTGTFLAATLPATLGLGFHYLVDLVVAVPFTAAIFVALCPVDSRGLRLQRALVIATVSLTGGWLALVRYAPRLLAATPAAQWGLALVTVVFSVGCVWYVRRRASISRRSRAPEQSGPSAPEEQPLQGKGLAAGGGGMHPPLLPPAVIGTERWNSPKRSPGGPGTCRPWQ